MDEDHPVQPHSGVFIAGSVNETNAVSSSLTLNQPTLDLPAPSSASQKLSQGLPKARSSDLSVADGTCNSWQPHYSSSLKFVFAIIIMIVWPWVFYGVVKQRDGVVMNSTLTNFARNHPQEVDYFVTAMASTISFVAGYLFQVSVTKFAQKWVVFEGTQVFHLSFFSALKNRTFIWSLGALPSVFKSATRFGLVLTVALYIGAFILVTPGLTALLHPQMIVRSSNLSSTEVDFSSTSPDCIEWFDNPSDLVSACGWATYKGFQYPTCSGDNQMVDALDSGRSSLLSLTSNHPESIPFTQLNDVHFLGPLEGVMPIGPNGLSVFDDLGSQWPAVASVIPNSYNYTLHLQGLQSDINCRYDTSSVSALSPSPVTPLISLFNGSCPPNKDVLVNPVYPVFVAQQTNNSLGYWACISSSSSSNSSESYDLYFRGDGLYKNMTGNITCSVSSVRSAIFPVEYRNRSNLFFVNHPLDSSAPQIYPGLVRDAINAVGHVVWGAQQYESSFLAETIVTFGVKAYKLDPLARNEMYLRLYEAMVQGLINYQLTYTRLLYTAGKVPRTSVLNSCTRPVTGTVHYTVMGWKVTAQIGAYLIPFTVVTVTSLVFTLIGMFTTKKLPTFDPTNPISLVVAAAGRDMHTAMEPIGNPEGTAAWKYQVQYNESQGRFVPGSGY